MKRMKKQALPEVTELDLEYKLAEYAKLSNEIETLEAEMNAKMTALRDKYLDKIEASRTQVKGIFEELYFWAEKQKERFGKKRSMDLQHGKIGFRMGTPKLKTSKGYTWAAVTTLLKELSGALYVRIKEETDKETLIAKHKEPEVIELMSRCGIQVVQEESFYIDLKKEELS